MKWIKRDECKTIEEVIQRNTGLPFNEFVNPPKSYYIKNLQEAADMINDAISAGINITIYGDYDADGITSSSILYFTLNSLGATSIDVVLPKRFSEGYGLSMTGVERIKSGLLITVDNGISAVDEIAAAKAKGLITLILDHHLPRDDGKIPDADIIVDPNALPGSDFNGYCGAGLAFKLAQLMLTDEDLLDRLLSLAAVGTVADVMPLIKDNRNIVIQGLKNINAGKSPIGFNTLVEQLDLYDVNEVDIGFKFGPIINAAGRMQDDGARKAFEMLTASDKNDARKKAQKLIEINEERKAIVSDGVSLCNQLIAQGCLYGENPLVIYTTKEMPLRFHEGVVGILAGRMAETYKIPAIILTETDSGILKGSGRSYGDIHLKNLLDSVSENLLGYGGHAGAAGLSVDKSKIEDFKTAIQAEMSKLPAVSVVESNEEFYDLEIRYDDIQNTMTKLNQYAPYGEGNPRPVFQISSVRLSPRAGKFYRVMGAIGQHIKMFCQNFDAVGFDMTEKFKENGEPMALDLLGSLSENKFGGASTLQVELVDFAKSKTTKTNSALADMLSQKLKERGL